MISEIETLDPTDKHRELLQVLDRFVQANEDPVILLMDLFTLVRPHGKATKEEAQSNFESVMQFLASHETYKTAVRERTVDLFERCNQVSFYTDAGILPNAGFFSELWRRIAHRILPDIPNPISLQDCMAIVFHDRWNALLLESGNRKPFWRYIQFTDTARESVLWKILEQLLESIQVLATRLAALGMEPELLRLMPELTKHTSPFLALSTEAHDFVNTYQEYFLTRRKEDLDESHLLVLIEQCETTVEKAEKKASRLGTSLSLTYILVRLNQSLRRLSLLSRFLGARFDPGKEEETQELWAELFQQAALGVVHRNSIRLHVANLIGLLALRVTENASITGEHYIAASRSEYWRIFRSAAGAGLLIGSMALLKILLSKLPLAPLQFGLASSLNYAACFVAVYMLHFTIATKQPAMTAATIASAIGEQRPKQKNWDHLVDLIVDTVRSQIAAIFGNVLVSFPTAIVVLLLLNSIFHASLVTADKAEHLLHDLHPLKSLAVIHAGIAGAYLFLSGLITGYFDNRAAYTHIGERIAGLRWLQSLVGKSRSEWIGNYIHNHLGGLTGNFLFGMMLGLTPVIGAFSGLPLDIRHITFSAANLGYALVAYSFRIPFRTLVWSIVGVAVIGLVNLLVSFALALWTALRSRGIRNVPRKELLVLTWKRFASNPRIFLQSPGT